MSNQQDKIKAFRLAQHARLQREDDEEWISGEELCTEGSSDEDTVSKSKCVHKKHKKSNKLGISPLALPIKNINKSDDDKSGKTNILPDINDNNKSVGSNENWYETKASTSKSDIQLSNLEESVRSNMELENYIQWRPKRGSLKLPIVAEGMPVEVGVDLA